MKLSIIVPVYRVESTLDKCITSIINQDYENIEIILVDDGSPDTCPAICDKWADNDSRIKVIHKTNGGLSDARNAGIDMASGDYITFIDSDDHIDKGIVSKLMNIIIEHPEYDILEYSIKQTGPNAEKELVFEDKKYNCIKKYWSECEAYNHSYACNKIYKTSLFSNIRFPKGKVFEDLYTLPLLTGKTQVIATTHIGFYNYFKNPNGITANASGNELKMLLMAHINLINNPYLELGQDSKYLMHVINIQMDVYELTKENPIITIKRIRNTNKLCLKAKIKAYAFNILGIYRLCKLNNAIHNIRKCLS